MSKIRAAEEEKKGDLKPHLDWKRNYMLAKDYLDEMKKEFPMREGVTKVYSFQFEKYNIGGAMYPWIFWMTVKHLNRGRDGSSPLLLQQSHTEFVQEFRRVLPGKRIISKVRGF